MALNQNRRPSADRLEDDREALLALRELRDYKPVNPSYSAEALAALEEALTRAQHEELRLQNALAAARDAATAAAWALHNAVLGAKAQVIAQYGADSDAIQSLGLKKKSERKRPTRRNGTTAS
jgi:hypothetical protein